MNQYEIVLINKSNIERTITVEAISEAAAVTNSTFMKQIQKGESIKSVNTVLGMKTYELIMQDFRGRLSSKRVKALNAQEAARSVDNELFFGSGKVIEVHELKRSARHG